MKCIARRGERGTFTFREWAGGNRHRPQTFRRTASEWKRRVEVSSPPRRQSTCYAYRSSSDTAVSSTRNSAIRSTAAATYASPLSAVDFEGSPMPVSEVTCVQRRGAHTQPSRIPRRRDAFARAGASVAERPDQIRREVEHRARLGFAGMVAGLRDEARHVDARPPVDDRQKHASPRLQLAHRFAESRCRRGRSKSAACGCPGRRATRRGRRAARAACSDSC